MVILATALPLTSRLVLENQENRSLAAYKQLGSSCTATSSCQPPLICSEGKCKNETIKRTGVQGLNRSCSATSDCLSPYVCYSGVCKSRSGGECTRTTDCYGNHYCSATNHHCRKIDSMWIGEVSVEGRTVASMLGSSTKPTRTPTKAPTKIPDNKITPTEVPTLIPTQAVTPTVLPNIELSLKFSILGVKANPICVNDLGRFFVKAVNVPTNTVELIDDLNFDLVSGKVNTKGNQVFELKLNLIGTKLDVTNKINYLLVDNEILLRRKLCFDKQEKRSERNDCDIDLSEGKAYDFSEYSLSIGDINGDQVVNSADFSMVKNNFSFSSEVGCGKRGDLNMDGMVNSLDIDLIKQTLSSREDE